MSKPATEARSGAAKGSLSVKVATAGARRVTAKATEPRKTTPALQSPKVAKPVLLAGGNPQIAKADGDAPVQAYIAAMPGWKRDVGLHRSVAVSLHCFAKYVKVAFFRGTSLRPVPPGESKHKDVRYLDIHEDDQLDEAQLAGWMKQASQLPGWGRT